MVARWLRGGGTGGTKRASDRRWQNTYGSMTGGGRTRTSRLPVPAECWWYGGGSVGGVYVFGGVVGWCALTTINVDEGR